VTLANRRPGGKVVSGECSSFVNSDGPVFASRPSSSQNDGTVFVPFKNIGATFVHK